MASSTDARIIALADADAFFVSVARLVDPEGAGKAPLLIVGGSPTGRGVVTSASYEARKFGVRSAMPTGQALRLCPNALVVGVPRKECVERSRQVREILGDFSPVVEQASIDEFYVDLTGTEDLFGKPPCETAVDIRTRVLDRTGLSFSIGVGSSKLVAKLAAQQAKPHRDASGVHNVAPGKEIEFMRRHDLAEIPLIGPRFQQRLARLGLGTVSDVLKLERDDLTTMFGERTGAWLFRRARGLDGSRINPGRPNRSVSHEGTFARDIKDGAVLEREIVRLASRVAADVRRKRMRARTVSVKIRFSDFATRQASKTLPEGVSADRPVIEAASQLLAKLRRARESPVRLLGVALSQLFPAAGQWKQLGLFDSTETDLETDHDVVLSNAVDRIRDRFGSSGIVRGAEVTHRRGQ